MLRFSFGNAFMHFARTSGPRGFIWKYLLSYFLCIIALTALLLFTGNAGVFAAIQNEQAAVLTIIVTYIVMFIFYAMFEAALQRRYVRDEGFKLRLAGDEFRILGVYVIWILFSVLLLFVFGLISSALGGIARSGGGVGDLQIYLIVNFVITVIFFSYWCFLAVRLSAASALTVRDRQIRFAASWRVTKGRFWALFGAHLVMLAGFVAIISAFAGVLWATSTDPGNVFEVIDTYDTPAENLIGLGIMGIIVFVLYIVSAAFWTFLWAGPAALAARTDPESAGYADPAAAFD